MIWKMVKFVVVSYEDCVTPLTKHEALYCPELQSFRACCYRDVTQRID